MPFAAIPLDDQPIPNEEIYSANILDQDLRPYRESESREADSAQ